ncbi:MAG: hypothetical protein EOO01_06150 [Chitinophagaceae bacterium]|nr:MAG: hypothetical protein EOO01_06150 [Chitinophagaceae bacterium]
MRGIRMALILKTIFIFVLGFHSFAQTAYNKQGFYDAMSSSDINIIDQELVEAQKATGLYKQAIIGTLTMKKAGFTSGAGKKLKVFKAGHKELEASIKQDSNNAEYRLMRLMIQENTPGILGYKKEIKGDSDYIRKSFKSLPGTVQQAIIHYAKSSKVLSEKDFN